VGDVVVQDIEQAGLIAHHQAFRPALVVLKEPVQLLGTVFRALVVVGVEDKKQR
jgi:hypothetical protein